MARSRSPVLLGLLVAAILAQCRIAGPLGAGATPSSQATGAPIDLPAEAQRLGIVRLATLQESAGAITPDVAIAAAAREGYNWPTPHAFLVIVTSKYASPSNPYSLVGAMSWLIYWDNVRIIMPAPTSTDLIFTKALVLVDARTGRVIRETYIEY